MFKNPPIMGSLPLVSKPSAGAVRVIGRRTTWRRGVFNRARYDWSVSLSSETATTANLPFGFCSLAFPSWTSSKVARAVRVPVLFVQVRGSDEACELSSESITLTGGSACDMVAVAHTSAAQNIPTTTCINHLLLGCPECVGTMKAKRVPLDCTWQKRLKTTGQLQRLNSLGRVCVQNGRNCIQRLGSRNL